jgi:hypothetical protein
MNFNIFFGPYNGIRGLWVNIWPLHDPHQLSASIVDTLWSV